jgi:hypothetical protein
VSARQWGNTVTELFILKSPHFPNFNKSLEKVIHQKMLKKKQIEKADASKLSQSR